MTIRTLVLLALAVVAGLIDAGPSAAQSFSAEYGARRPPALGRVSPAPSIYSNRTRPAYAPAYRRPSRVCTIRTVRERIGDRFIERRYEQCRERW